MDGAARIFAYCERGSDPGFWAEPFNAVSNAAFLIAALAAGFAYSRSPPQSNMRRLAVGGLIALVFVIGVGSFLFHTFATRWAAIADVAPIGVFMLAYVAFALRVFLQFPWIVVAAGIATFVAALSVAGGIDCPPDTFGLITRGRCLGGTLGYAPALLAMLGVAVALALRRDATSLWIGAASAVFLLSMIARATDLTFCADLTFMGHARGTHALWHVLNATTLWLLLRASIGGAQGTVARPARSAHNGRFSGADVVEPVDTQDLKS